MAITALYIANNILDIAFKNHVKITPIKLQRLLYLVYNGYLKQTGSTLFNEPFVTFAYGPVCESVYYKFKCFGAKPITRYATDAHGGITMVDTKHNSVLRHILSDIEAIYLTMPINNLCELVRQPGTAWYNAYQSNRRELTRKDVENDPCFRI